MNILQLHEMGAFVPTKLVKKSVVVDVPVQSDPETWADPDVPEFTGETEASTIDLTIRRMSSADEIALANAPRDEQAFVMIHRMIRDEAGAPLFESVEQVMQLSSWMLVPILGALEGVAHTDPKKTSRARTSSGSKSRSRSVAGRPKSGSTPSAPSGETS